MWLNGRQDQSPLRTYSVTVNSFLSTGGDNFSAFAGGTGKQDTGKTDLQGMVDCMARFGSHEAAAGGLQPASGRSWPSPPPPRRRTPWGTT